jgi:hypothetical protein
MTYAQVLRLRNSFRLYAIIVGAVIVLSMVFGHAPNAHFQFDAPRVNGHPSGIPLSGILFFSAWCAIVYATIVSNSLNREYDGIEMVWTKPIAHARLAFLYIALDVAAIVLAFVFASAGALLAVASFGWLQYVHVDARTLPTAFIGVGTALMAYGIMQGITASIRGRSQLVIGLGWAAAFVVLGLAEGTIHADPAIHGIFVALDVINPLAYFSSYSLSGYGAHGSPVLPQFLAGTEMRTMMTWGIGLIGCAAAVAGWRRLEA